jgi:hypothetical protein
LALQKLVTFHVPVTVPHDTSVVKVVPQSTASMARTA